MLNVQHIYHSINCFWCNMIHYLPFIFFWYLVNITIHINNRIMNHCFNEYHKQLQMSVPPSDWRYMKPWHRTIKYICKFKHVFRRINSIPFGHVGNILNTRNSNIKDCCHGIFLVCQMQFYTRCSIFGNQAEKVYYLILGPNFILSYPHKISIKIIFNFEGSNIMKY